MQVWGNTSEANLPRLRAAGARSLPAGRLPNRTMKRAGRADGTSGNGAGAGAARES